MAGQIPVINGAIRLEGDTTRLPKMVEDARRASQQIEQEFDKSFERIGRVAAQALSIPRNAAGALDLDVGQYHEAARAAQAQATALREIANAAKSAAASNEDNSTATRRYVAAAQAAAREAETQAREALDTAKAYDRLQGELNQTASAFQDVIRAQGVGTTANHMMVNSTRSLRVAMVQSGQQLQDVAISLYSGQKASVVFAQQLPQLAFALSNLEGSANKTHDRIGRFATFLSGPWGLAVGLAVGVLGTFIASLVQGEDQADDTGSAVSRLKDKIDLSKNSYESLIAVVNEYNKSQERSEALTLAAAEAAEKKARANLTLASSQLEVLKTEAMSVRPGARGSEALQASADAAVREAEEDIAKLEKELRESELATNRLRIKGELDPIVAAQQAAERRIGILDEELRLKKISREKHAADVLKIERELEAELERIRKSKSSGSGGSTKTRTNAQAMADFKAALAAEGIRVISDTRSAAQQNALFRQGLTPLDGYKRVSRHQTTQAVDVDKTTHSDERAYAAAQKAGLKGFEIVTESGGRKHYEWSGHGAAGEIDVAGIERAAEAAARLAEFGRDARAQIEAIGRSFADTPPAIQESERELERLNDLAADIMMKRPEGWEAMLAAIEALRPAAEALRDGPFRDMLEQADEQARIEQLLIEGKIEEAEVQRRINDLTRDQGTLLPEQEQAIRDIVAQERLRARLLDQQAEARQRELDYLDETYDNLRRTTHDLLSGKGIGSIGNFFKRQFDAVIANMADSITESLFGDFFRDEKDRALGFDKVKKASEETARVSNAAADALNKLTHAANGTTAALTGIPANDNLELKALQDAFDAAFPGIEVVGRKDTGKIVRDALKGLGKDIFGEEAMNRLSSVMRTGMERAAIGQFSSGIARSLGLKQSNTGAQLGGALGGAVGSLIPGIGSVGGSLIGGLFGGTLGGLFKKTKSGAANITGLDGVSLYGNSGAFRTAASGAAGSVQDGLARIAEQLGGSVGSFNVTIGQRHGDWRVRTGTGSLKIKKGAKEFDDDEAGAIKYAISLAVQQGAILGLRAATQRLLQSGSDIEAQLEKAVKFQSVFDELDSLKDPVGFAVRSLNREFEGLIRIFQEAGASAEDYAQLEELYGIKRAKAVEEANERIIGSLKSFYDQLTVGNEALSLRDRRAAAQANYDPLAARVKAGDATAYDAFAEAAQALLDIERQIYGSQSQYFELNDEITRLVKATLDSQNSLTSLPGSIAEIVQGGSGTTSSPDWTAYLAANQDVLAEYTRNVDKSRFSTAEAYAQWHYSNYGQAEGRAMPASQAAVVGALDTQTQDLLSGLGGKLDAMNDNLITLIQQGQNTGTGWSLGAGGYW